MKIYAADRQLRLVGKCWEIRHYLKQQLEQAGRDATLDEFLGGRVIEPSGKMTLRKPAVRYAADSLRVHRRAALKLVPRAE
ncbi:Z-ring formation inhibitor MciZ [Paenibacillus sp. YYML68]|uniref:Z-ring formation inhibitor MciZ n=1 Tax=Paenibacillus sp. YYML68 TaxID=2909250 RepID=UPI00249017FE|nr:Z-ring formation inhibitor MciZ [Paenibacillus sp. YYML68]